MNINRKKFVRLAGISLPTLAYALAQPADARPGLVLNRSQATKGVSSAEYLNSTVTPNTFMKPEPNPSIINTAWYKTVTVRGPMRADLKIPKPKIQLAYTNAALDDPTILDDLNIITMPAGPEVFIPVFIVTAVVQLIPSVRKNLPKSILSQSIGHYEATITGGNYVTVPEFVAFKTPDNEGYFVWSIECQSEGSKARLGLPNTFNPIATRFMNSYPINNIICQDTTRDNTPTGYQGLKVLHIDGSDGGTYDDASHTITLNSGDQRKQFYLELVMTALIPATPLANARTQYTLSTNGGTNNTEVFADDDGKIRIPLGLQNPDSTIGPLTVSNIYGQSIFYAEKIIGNNIGIKGIDSLRYATFLKFTGSGRTANVSFDEVNNRISLVQDPQKTSEKWKMNVTAIMGPMTTGGQLPNRVVTAYFTTDQVQRIAATIGPDSRISFDVEAPSDFISATLQLKDENSVNLTEPVLVTTDSTLENQPDSLVVTENYSERQVYLAYTKENNINTYYVSKEKWKSGDWKISFKAKVSSQGKDLKIPVAIIYEYETKDHLIQHSANSLTDTNSETQADFDLIGFDAINKIVAKAQNGTVLAQFIPVETFDRKLVTNDVYAVSTDTGYLAGTNVTIPVKKQLEEVIKLSTTKKEIKSLSYYFGNKIPEYFETKETNLDISKGTANLTIDCSSDGGSGTSITLYDKSTFALVSKIDNLICSTN